MKYRRLTSAERYQIEVLLQTKTSIREMGKVLGRSASTVLRELNRNKYKNVYSGHLAEVRSRKRRKGIGPEQKITGSIKDYVDEALKTDWSPEQIKGRLALEHRSCISTETIYKYVYNEAKKRNFLWHHLRRKRQQRVGRDKAKRTYLIGKRIDRTWITERPKEVEVRHRIGDVERDTVEGKRSGPLLLTLVDRSSRLTMIKWMPRKNAFLTHEATMEALRNYNVQTITNDNGAEFGMHDITSETLNTKIYFTKPYCSWQRGTNENTNGLIRQYFPKRQHPDPTLVEHVENLLNNRPRKCLGFRTPNEVHHEKSRCCAEI